MSWSELRYYESKESLRKLCSTKLGYNLSCVRSEQIISCFHMARDYYASALAANITIAPLLMYYSMTNLAKAVTLIFGGKTYTSLESLGESHGLGMIKKDSTPSCLEQYKCKINGSGTFVSFLNTVSYDVKFHVFDNQEIRLKVSRGDELLGKQIALKDILLNIPALKTLCAKTFEQSPKITPVLISAEHDVFDLEYTKPKYTLRFYDNTASDLGITLETPENWDRISWHDKEGFIISKDIPKRFSYWSEFDQIFNDPHSPAIRGRAYLDPTRQPLFSTWISCYVGIYIMGMIVRYYPDIWVSIISRKTDSQILAILESFISISSVTFPAHVLALLDNPLVVNEKYVLGGEELPYWVKSRCTDAA